MPLRTASAPPAPSSRMSVEVVLVVGAANSSNSNRLRELAAEQGVPAYLIADADALDPTWLKDARSVGITAGASAPAELVQELIDRLGTLDHVELATLPGITENVRFRMPADLVDPAAEMALQANHAPEGT